MTPYAPDRTPAHATFSSSPAEALGSPAIGSQVFHSLVAEVARLARAVESMSEQVSRLTTKVERPDLVKHSIEEAARRLGRSRSSVYELIKAGELTPVRERGRTFLTEEECRRWERASRDGRSSTH